MKFTLAPAFISAVVSAVQADPEPAVAASLQHRTCCYPTTALLRSFNSKIGDHFYTTNATEMQNAVAKLGYQPEGDAAQIHHEETPITIPLYRLYNPTAFDHFYTTNSTERDAAGGYNYEGITGYVYGTPLCGTVPLYRMYSAGATDHFYTISEDEKDNAVANLGYAYEGIAAYVNPQD